MFVGMRDGILAGMELADPYGYLRRMGVEAMEVWIGPDLILGKFEPVRGEPLLVGSTSDCERVLAAGAEAGVRIGGVLLNTRYDSPDLDAGQEDRLVAAAAELAHVAGLDVMRIDVRPGGSATRSEDEFLERVRPLLAEHLRIARDHGVGLAVENHGRFTNRREFLSQLLDEFAPLGLSVTLDTGNFYCTGGYPLSQLYDVIESFVPATTHVHLKNIRYPAEAREVQGHLGCTYGECSCPIDEGDVDHGRIFAMLKEAGYDGGLYIEDESLGKVSPPQREEIITRTIAYLEGLLADLE